jgi:hypothetical protein
MALLTECFSFSAKTMPKPAAATNCPRGGGNLVCNQCSLSHFRTISLMTLFRSLACVLVFAFHRVVAFLAPTILPIQEGQETEDAQFLADSQTRETVSSHGSFSCPRSGVLGLDYLLVTRRTKSAECAYMASMEFVIDN